MINETLIDSTNGTSVNGTMAGAAGASSSWLGYLLGNEYFAASIFMMFTTWLLTMTRTWFQNAWDYIIHHFVFTITVSKTDEAYLWLTEWLAEQPYAKTTRNLTLRSSWSHAMQSAHGGKGHGYYGGYYNREPQASTVKRPELYYVPAAGVHIFFHKGALLWFSRKGGNDAGANAAAGSEFGNFGMPMMGGRGGDRGGSTASSSGSESDGITLTALGYSRTYLEAIVKEAMELYYSKSEGKTWIYSLSAMMRNNWTKTCERKNRSFESVILPEEMKTDVMQDIKRFMDSAEWYRNAGVPYRRGYLLYGPPGTGKTSLILSIAGSLNASVCMLNLNATGLNDNLLNDMLHNTPANSIILLEDIDCAFVKRNTAADIATYGGVQGITFSGLLNALDGVASQEGRILFMTTNHIERLSTALMRPGRIDKKVEFKQANKYQIEQMFTKFFPEHAKTAPQVSAKIKEYTVSPAELQGLYLNNRDNPQLIPSKVDKFLQECEQDHKRQEEEKKKEEKEQAEKEKRQKMRKQHAFSFEPNTPPSAVEAAEAAMDEELDKAMEGKDAEDADKSSSEKKNDDKAEDGEESKKKDDDKKASANDDNSERAKHKQLHKEQTLRHRDSRGRGRGGRK